MKKVTIKKVTLTNFRNIANAEYDLTEACCFVGKNYTGKTNSILAIYWVFTDKMLDGSDNSSSLKPLSNTKDKVAVELEMECDGEAHTIKKEFAEKWTKNRGTSELSLTSHDTTYTIDGITQKSISNALKEMNELIGIDSQTAPRVTKLDTNQMLMNPLYLAEILPWKTLRELVFSIIGEVSNEEIMRLTPTAQFGTERLKAYNYDSSKALQFTNQKIAEHKDSILKAQASADEFAKTVDATEEELDEATDKINEINRQIADLNNGAKVVNPAIAVAKERKENLLKEINELYTAERTEYSNKVQVLNRELKSKSDILIEEMTKKMNLATDLSSLKNQLVQVQSKIDMEKTTMSSLQDKKLDVRQAVIEETEKKFIFEEIKCPNCGTVINESAKEEAEAKWKEEHENILNNYKTTFESLKLKIKNSELKINDYIAMATEFSEKVDAKTEELNKQIDKIADLNAKKDNSVQVAPVFKESDTLVQKRQDLAKLNLDINNLMSADIVANDKTAVIDQLEQSKEPYNAILTKHIVYTQDQERLKYKNYEIDMLGKKQATEEMIKEAILEFEKSRLHIYDDRIAEHFHDVKFVLIEKNMKEGSWNQVCYPLIIGKNTPFENGSTSEKAMTGIALIEAMKRELKLPDLPIFIDECSQLDLDSLARIKGTTNAQIIATKVDDNFDKPKVIEL